MSPRNSKATYSWMRRSVRLPLPWVILVSSLLLGIIATELGSRIFAPQNLSVAGDSSVVLANAPTTMPVSSALNTGSSIDAMVQRSLPSFTSVSITYTDGVSVDNVIGAIVSESGLVVIPSFLLVDANQVRATLSNGKSYQVKVMGADSETGYGLIELPVSGLTPVPLAPAETVVQSEMAIAICPGMTSGSSGGMPIQISAQGFDSGLNVSAVSVLEVDRKVQTTSGQEVIASIITDRPIGMPGHGGILLDGGGKLLGIKLGAFKDYISQDSNAPPSNSSVPSSSIPASEISNGQISVYSSTLLANTVVNDLFLSGSVKHGWLGLDGDSAPGGGVVVEKVLLGGAASKAGIVPGDIIFGINGQNISNLEELQSATYGIYPGTKIYLSIDSQGTTKVVPVTLSAS
ncbi:MAG: serine protease [Acidimicrobiales bacterium]|nr:serine protease [Acidimicrobiales bacterium]